MSRLMLSLLWLPLWAGAQHTFSIVAVDSATRQVGSAGASCIDTTNSYNINRINEIVPGRGAVNAQAYWDFKNLANGKARMLAGDSPRQILDWLMANDSEKNPEKMQYGIVDLGGGQPRSIAFSGGKALDYKGHKTGRDYAIQGNILIGKQVLDSMESRWLKAKGTFADRLMAALQGANFPGADKRCLAESVSSRSSFIRVALPADRSGAYYLDLNVPARPYGVEPIDELQKKYNAWKGATGREPPRNLSDTWVLRRQARGMVTLDLGPTRADRIEWIGSAGQTHFQQNLSPGRTAVLDLRAYANGIYWAHLYRQGVRIGSAKVLLLK